MGGGGIPLYMPPPPRRYTLGYMYPSWYTLGYMYPSWYTLVGTP